MNGKCIVASLWGLSAAVALLAISLDVPAVEDKRREHGAHEHGHGSLDVVVEGDELVTALRVPAVNVVGFEHEPSTDEQRRAVEEALAVFRQGAKLFAPSKAARCAVEKVEVGLGGIEGHEGEEHEHQAEHDKDEDQQREYEGEKVEEHKNEAHSELHGEYHFRCEAPEKLKRLAVRVFEHLTDAEELEARVVTSTAQTAAELTPRDTVLKLAR